MNRNLIITAGLLVCVMEPTAERHSNGRLLVPPRLSVLVWSEEHRTVRVVDIDWQAAEALAPDDMLEIKAELARRRNDRDAEITLLAKSEAAIAAGVAYVVAGRNEIERKGGEKSCACSDPTDTQQMRVARCRDNPGIGYRCDLYGHPGKLCDCAGDCSGSLNPDVCRRLRKASEPHFTSPTSAVAYLCECASPAVICCKDAAEREGKLCRNDLTERRYG